MRQAAYLLLLVPALLVGQSARLDEGRLDPAWFGPSVTFQPSKTLGLQWLKPGLDLRRRALHLKGFEAPAWVLGQRAIKDEVLLGRMEQMLVPELAKGLRRGLKGALAISLSEGDVLLVGRVVDATGDAEDGVGFGGVSLSLDLKLVDGDTRELLGAFHDTLMGLSADALSIQYARWCEHLGRLLATAVVPPVVAAPVVRPSPVPPPPSFDLEGALRRIEGLRRDGLLSDEESQLLRRKAAEKAK